MLIKSQPPRIDLPKGWTSCVQESWRYGCFFTQSEKDVCQMEHRYYPRIAIQNRLFIHVNDTTLVIGVTKNISKSGLFLGAADSARLKKNMLVRVAFMVNGMLVTLASQVIRTAENEAATMFIEETSARKQALKEWLNADTLTDVTACAGGGKQCRQCSVSPGA